MAQRWLGSLWGARGRRVSVYSNRRVHIECRPLDPENFRRFADELGEALDRLDGVEGYHINGILNRVVVGYRSPLTDPESLLALVEGIEAHCGVDDVRFPDDSSYPGDPDEFYRKAAEIGADVLGASIGIGLKLVSRNPSAAEFDLAAFMSFIEDSPKIRRRLERLAGPEAFDFVLGMVNTFIQAVGSGPIGPLVSMTHQFVQMRGVYWHDRAWRRFEPYVSPCGERFRTPPVSVGPRPRSVPDGPVERYADEAWFASLGGFVVALADTHELEPSTAPLFGGLPKAARYGRSGFNRELVRVLSRQGMIVLHSDPFELLDRIDTVLIDGRLLRESEPEVELVVRAARKAGLKLLFSQTDAERASRLRARALPDTGRSIREEIRDLQEGGGCVAAFGRFEADVLRAADFGVGVPRVREPVPWGADVVTTPAVEDCALIVEAIGQAKAVANDSVLLAGVGATLGTFLSLRGLRETNPGTIKLAVNAVSLVALSNGVNRALDLERRPRPKPRDPTPWHSLSAERVLEHLESSSRGLTQREVAQRREPTPAPLSDLGLIRRAVVQELSNPLTPVLGAAASASAVVGSVADAALVGTVVLFNAAIGGYERYRSERAVRDLEERDNPRVHAIRDGSSRHVDAGELVPGDIVRFEAGDVVPVDCRLLTASELEADESALTGESVPVRKTAAPSDAEHVSDRRSMLYDGTSIAAGEAEAVVVAVGDRTEANRRPIFEPERHAETGVETRLRTLTDTTLPIAGAGGALLTAIGLLRNQDLRSLADTGLGMAVAAVPEGLPLLATVAQLAASRRLTKQGVLVRNPRALEAIGRIDVLCADKTGTLTRGQIRLDVVSDGAKTVRVDGETGAAWMRHIVAAALRASPPAGDREEFPHPTDRAIIEGARRLDVDVTEGHASWDRFDGLPFQPRRGYHAVIGRNDEGWLITVKGAPETVLERCSEMVQAGERQTLEPQKRLALIEHAESLAEEGLRVLCLAERAAARGGALDDERIDDLTFLGLVGLSDPARPTAGSAVAKLKKAGIRTLMITGDHPKTADRIARDVGLPDGDAVLTGGAIEEMTDDELAEIVPDISVIARVTPSQKGRIVRALQANGRVVAMAGDGANDASAIRLAEVGIALGEDATRAARDAADIVVLDENIETMVHAVGEGRAMLEAVRDAVAILAGGNFGEIGFTVLGSLLSETPPLNARQLLLVNLMTDIAPAMALAIRTPDAERLEALLAQDPEDILSQQLDRALTIRAVATAGGATCAWALSRLVGCGAERASTAGLVALVGTQLGQTVFLGQPTRETMLAGVGSSALLLGTVAMPGISQLFGCRPIGPINLTIAVGSSAAATAAAGLASWASKRPDGSSSALQ